ncbi:MAG: hypothetical protein HUJ26_23155 [Planctomycetaceae bacterium]|nr:hypothetical protein [Planctomycetaceae bacterium]
MRAVLILGSYLLLVIQPVASAQTSEEIFEKRLLPIFQSPKPSSCTECHLSGVELKQYILPTQEATFAALLKMKMIDTEHPEKSKILEFIARAPDSESLVSKKMRQQELDAFKSWILAASKDPELRNTKATAKAGPTVPDEVIRHARKDRVLQSFVDNVWSEVGRCAACHSPDRNQKQVKEHGDSVSWIMLDAPQATMNYLIENEILNTDNPEKSYLLLKPTNQIEHGGGVKLKVGDRTYKQFLKFATDYAHIVNDDYKTAEMLPEQSNEVSQVSEIWFKVTGVPEKYHQKLLKVDIYRAGNDRRVATADRQIFGPKQLWQNHLSLTAPRDSKRAQEIRRIAKLPPGEYVARISIDKTDRLERNPDADWTEDDYIGQVPFRTDWPPGYGRMTVIEYPH